MDKTNFAYWFVVGCNVGACGCCTGSDMSWTRCVRGTIVTQTARAALLSRGRRTPTLELQQRRLLAWRRKAGDGAIKLHTPPWPATHNPQPGAIRYEPHCKPTAYSRKHHATLTEISSLYTYTTFLFLQHKLAFFVHPWCNKWYTAFANATLINTNYNSASN